MILASGSLILRWRKVSSPGRLWLRSKMASRKRSVTSGRYWLDRRLGTMNPPVPLQATHTSAFRNPKSDLVDFLSIGLVWIAMIVLANPMGDFPLNDDWVYALAVKSVLETGHFQFPSGSLANVG